MGAPAGGNPPLMLTMGDSVIWGQGLLDDSKFRTLVCDYLSFNGYPGLTQLPTLAHSGAVIGTAGDTDTTWAPGEIPRGYPSIFQQCAGYSGNIDDVRVILLDGGINDISVEVIADPRTNLDDLRGLIEKYCHDAMLKLLDAVAARFTYPDCRIIVTGYYEIIGAASQYSPTISFLELLGILSASELLRTAAGFSDLVTLSKLFRSESDLQLGKAVSEFVAGSGRKVTFVQSGFTSADCLFQDESLLWGFKGLPIDAADDLRDYRTEACPIYSHGTGNELFCRFASVGHPNANGAIKFYEQIKLAFP